MSYISTLLAVGWPGGGLTGPSPDWVPLVSLGGTVLLLFGVYHFAIAGSGRRGKGHRRPR